MLKNGASPLSYVTWPFLGNEVNHSAFLFRIAGELLKRFLGSVALDSGLVVRPACG